MDATESTSLYLRNLRFDFTDQLHLLHTIFTFVSSPQSPNSAAIPLNQPSRPPGGVVYCSELFCRLESGG